MNEFAKTPSPPYYAVIFTTIQSDDHDGYTETNDRMLELAGCLATLDRRQSPLNALRLMRVGLGSMSSRAAMILNCVTSDIAADV